MPAPLLKFNIDDLIAANHAWGCNCGPSALAACCGLTLSESRTAFIRFESAGYVNPADMRDALLRVRMQIALEHCDGVPELNIYPEHGLCLVQFSGPWTNGPRPNPKWAACHTHWIAAKKVDGTIWIFDCNRGDWASIAEWDRLIVPQLIAADPLRDGEFWLKHSWEVRKTKR